MPVFRVGIVCNDGGGEQRTDCVLLARGLAYGSMGNEPERRHQVSGVTCQHVQRDSTLSGQKAQTLLRGRGGSESHLSYNSQMLD